MLILDSTDPRPISDEELDDLKKALIAQETLYSNLQIDKSIQDEIGRETDLQKLVNSLKKEIDFLTTDLKNLQNIRDTLPTKCFNLIHLEQEGQ